MLRKRVCDSIRNEITCTDRGAVGLATYVFVTGIRATLQKHFALKGGAARPNFLVKFYRRGLLSKP